MQQALAHAYKDQELAIVAALKTVYFMAKKILPNDHFSDLKHFLVIQGNTAIGNLSFQCQSGGWQFTYEHSESVRSFQESIAALVDADLDNDLLRAEFYSVLIGDIGTDHNLVIHMRYVLDGEVHTRFLCLVELTGGTASEIVDTVLKVFTPRRISHMWYSYRWG